MFHSLSWCKGKVAWHPDMGWVPGRARQCGRCARRQTSWSTLGRCGALSSARPTCTSGRAWPLTWSLAPMMRSQVRRLALPQDSAWVGLLPGSHKLHRRWLVLRA